MIEYIWEYLTANYKGIDFEHIENIFSLSAGLEMTHENWLKKTIKLSRKTLRMCKKQDRFTPGVCEIIKAWEFIVIIALSLSLTHLFIEMHCSGW